MQCPTCQDAQLVMAERSGVEIDYCPKCRGIWLDRGELDKLLERASAQQFGAGASGVAGAARPAAPVQAAPPLPQQPQYQQPYPPQRRYDDDDDDDDRRYHQPHPQHGQPHYRKRKSWLGELLDFD